MPGHVHEVEFCRCGNRLADCGCDDSGSKIRVNIMVCRCDDPGPMRGVAAARLSTTNKGYVQKTMDDLDQTFVDQAKYQRHTMSERAKRNRHLGRLVFD